MGALLAATDMNPWQTIIFATAGNVAGTMFNYYVGRIWNIESICKWMRIKQKKLERTKSYVERHGAWIASFSFLPVLGSAIAISLGILRANAFGVMLWSLFGKLTRYIIVAWSVLAITGR